jgi:hypothetical protein
MSLEWEQIIIDSPDPLRLGRWWARALDWVIVDENDTEIEIRASADRLPGILIGVDREEKVVKNRLGSRVRCNTPRNGGSSNERSQSATD